jgi:hypothetical protein
MHKIAEQVTLPLSVLVIILLMTEVSPTKEPTPNIKKLENKMFSTERMARWNLWSAVMEESKGREFARNLTS